MPRDGFAFAVRIRCEIDRARFFQLFLNVGDVLLIALNRRVVHFEVVIGLYRTFLCHKITDVAIRSEDFEVFAEVLLDSSGLSRRFYDHKMVSH